MRVKRFLPEQFAHTCIQGINLGPQVSEMSDVDGSDGDGGAHAVIRLEAPISASGGCVQRIDLAGGTADEDAASRDHWLGVRGKVTGKSKSPLQLEFRDLFRTYPCRIGRLEAAVVQIHAPAVPSRSRKAFGRLVGTTICAGRWKLPCPFASEELPYRQALHRGQDGAFAAHRSAG